MAPDREGRQVSILEDMKEPRFARVLVPAAMLVAFIWAAEAYRGDGNSSVGWAKAKRDADEAAREADEATREADEAARAADRAKQDADEAERAAGKAETAALQAENDALRAEIEALEAKIERLRLERALRRERAK